ncbi:MAG: hypothetical protein JTT11_08130, partial [Candidatus Brockarchaeota archaeon]|nr:hypothetical protein [Candidatus Brockarchaeota archaeon]
MVKIVPRKFGFVKDEFVECVKGVMEECYRRLGACDVPCVDLYLFEGASRMSAFFSGEKRLLGIESKGLEEAFAAQHDAWRGTSRISICVERIGAMPEEVRIGTIRHEVGHSVLHGSLEHYLIPPALVERASAKMPWERARIFLYLVSIAVKDYEVTRLLYRKGYVEDQVAYALSSIGASEEDKLAWLISENDPAARAICAASRLKEVCCAAPFLGDERFGGALLERLASSLDYMGGGTAKRLLFIATRHLPSLGDDTLENIRIVSDLALEAFPL